MHDVVVVGARCAGSPLAMLLAQKGYDVLAVDRAHFPSDTMSTHFIQSPGMARLAQWGLVDRLFATGCPPITKLTLAVDDGPKMEMDAPPRPGMPGLASPRRYVLDKLLVDAAREAGAEVREGVTVTRPITEAGRVAGIEGYTNEGPFRAEARFVVAADGRNSALAETFGAEFRKLHPEKAVGYYSYFENVDFEGIYLHVAGNVFCVAFPTHDDLLTIAVAWAGRDVKEVRGDIEGEFLRTLDSLGDFGAKVRAGRRTERYVGLADISNFLRKANGPGWALAGDALYFKDPAPADGISDAFRCAEYLSETLDEILSGRAAEDEAFSRFEERHDEYALPLLDQTVKLTAEETTAGDAMDTFIAIRMLNEQESDAIQQNEGIKA
jgi:flavin-dependent dehydrogenase